MLVLSRKIGQRIVIGEDIVLTILDIRGGQVRLGIDAPRSQPIYREELMREAPHENTIPKLPIGGPR